MGYVLAIGDCICCKRHFAFNPKHVPSTKAITGRAEPICYPCITVINEKRQAMNLDLFPIHPEAYESCDENEL